MNVSHATNQQEWNSFLLSCPFRPFLQSWEMGEVYRDLGHETVRLELREEGKVMSICFGHVVPAKRGRHLSIPYGPILEEDFRHQTLGISSLLDTLQHIAKEAGCSFIRMSPFWPASTHYSLLTTHYQFAPSPLHLLAEHLWYLPLITPDPWEFPISNDQCPINFQCSISKTQTSNEQRVNEQQIFAGMRPTARNLIRRAEKEGVTVEASPDPVRDLPLFLALHEETRQHHRFTPYTDAFFIAQVKHFLKSNVSSLHSPSCTLYLARYRGEVIAASIHMHFGGETSYHHGASSPKYSKIPASYLLQWTAIQDALKRGDYIYNFWGIAPMPKASEISTLKSQISNKLSSINYQLSTARRHPFAGVTTFKTAFGGKPLELVHCMDLPLSPSYHFTRLFEQVRKWQRGF